jgi:hypothetical protein
VTISLVLALSCTYKSKRKFVSSTLRYTTSIWATFFLFLQSKRNHILNSKKLEEWRSFLKGLAEAAGLEVEFEPTIAETDEQVENSQCFVLNRAILDLLFPIVEKAIKIGSRKKIRAETMSELDLRILFNTLVDHFTTSQMSVVQNPLDDEDNDVADLYDIFDKDGADMGVTKFRLVDNESLKCMLDFAEGCPILFAKYRHTDTMTTAWDNLDDMMWEDGDTELRPLRLLWHQLCGVASLVDGIFQMAGNRVDNRLLADDVGIGKSAQVMGMIAFLILVWFVEKKGTPRPPIIADGESLVCVHDGQSRLAVLHLDLIAVHSRTRIHGQGPCP